MLKVEVVTPEKRVWSGEAKMVSARTLEGDLGVLPGHAPLLGVLADGTVSAKKKKTIDKHQQKLISKRPNNKAVYHITLNYTVYSFS